MNQEKHTNFFKTTNISLPLMCDFKYIFEVTHLKLAFQMGKIVCFD